MREDVPLREISTDELAQRLVTLEAAFYAHKHDFIGSGSQQAQIVEGYFQSANFKTGVSGWQIEGEGNVEFGSGKFRGDITGATGTFSGALSSSSGTIGGFDIGASSLSTLGITLDSGGTITTTTLQTGATGSRMFLNANTLQFYTSADVNFMTISNGNSEIDITHQGSAAAIDIDYAASGARDSLLMLLSDTNQGSDSGTSSPVAKIYRTNGSSSIDNLLQVWQEGGTNAVVDLRQHSTAGVATARIYQQDVSETALYIGNATNVSEADIGLLEIYASGSVADKVGIYIVPQGTTGAHMRWYAGTAPASPQDGDFWYDGANLKIRVGATTKTLAFV